MIQFEVKICVMGPKFQEIAYIKDVDLVRNILVKDFDSFVDRASSNFKHIFDKSGSLTDKIWGKQMTSASGDEWKNIRSTFSPIFTAGKMKAMLIFMQETCSQLQTCIDKHADKNDDFELKNMLGKYRYSPGHKFLGFFKRVY